VRVRYVRSAASAGVSGDRDVRYETAMWGNEYE
jgi:hypothetical protein